MGLHARTRVRLRTARIASRWVRAWVPEPMMARSPASEGASVRVATPLTAAVRMAVISEASRMAVGRPCSDSKRTTRPWWDSRPAARLPGKTEITLAPNAPERPPGIMARMPRPSAMCSALRSGLTAVPRAKSASVSAIRSTQRLIGSRSRISARPSKRSSSTPASCAGSGQRSERCRAATRSCRKG